MSTSSPPQSSSSTYSTRPRFLLHALRLHSAGLRFLSLTLEIMARHQQLLACIGWLLLLGLSGIVYCATRWASHDRAVSSSEQGFFDITVSDPDTECGNQNGTRWAILIAGSSGFGNYRHQADVCHAYHVLRKGGLREENIVVFMYDDIANNPMNPHPGTIINSPLGENVYAGVPKDYTGSDVTTKNFLAAFLGNKSAVTGGSRKVIDSGPEDHIFLFYSDHGGPGVLGMPTEPHLYADELVEAFKKKYEAGGYKEMLVYLEACESGSIFEGILPDNLNIYATTASDARESSWGTYCPGMFPPPPPEYMTCLGDLYSVSWMEDSEEHNLSNETLEQQYDNVKIRTSNYNTYTSGSHVMCYGTLRMAKQKVCAYLGTNHAKGDFTKGQVDLLMPSSTHRYFSRKQKRESLMQRDADLLYLWHKYKSAQEGSQTKLAAQDELFETLAHRRHIDRSVQTVSRIVELKYSGELGTLPESRTTGQPLVDDWLCLKSMVHAFEVHCGRLKSYGLKHMRVFANMCNTGVQVGDLESASTVACEKVKRDI